MGNTLELAEALQALRENLLAARKDMSEDLQLGIDEIEVELQTVVTKEGQGKAKLEVLNVAQLLGLGGAKAELSGRLAKVATQKIKLKISPQSIDPKSGKKGKMQLAGDE